MLRAGVDAFVASVAADRSSAVALDLLVTPHSMLLSDPTWAEHKRTHDADGIPTLDDCFVVMPHAPAATAHDARRITRDIARDRALLEWFTECDGARNTQGGRFAPGPILPHIPVCAK